MLVLYNNILLETDDILVFLDVLSLSRILLFRFTCMNFPIILQEGLNRWNQDVQAAFLAVQPRASLGAHSTQGTLFTVTPTAMDR